MRRSAIFVIIFTFFILFVFYSFFTYSQLQEKTPTSTPSLELNSSNIIDISEISKHNQRNSCYLIIQNKVYDVSSYISQHPGGQGKIINKCGQEVTGVFAQIHSNFAWDLLKKYQVGQL